MLYQALDGGFLVRIERGEELIDGLARLMAREQVGCGAVTGLGAVDAARLGLYHVGKKSYRERSFDGEFEVCGLTGTLSWYEGSPFPHVHLLLTGPDFEAVGGHCFEARVSATLELFIRSFDPRIARHVDDEIGLHLMDLPTHCPLR